MCTKAKRECVQKLSAPTDECVAKYFLGVWKNQRGNGYNWRKNLVVDAYCVRNSCNLNPICKWGFIFSGGGGWGALPLWESVGMRMRRGFAPHSRHLDDLFAPQNWTTPTISFRSCWVHFEAPHFQHVDALFAPQIDQIYHFIQILLGPILNFERRTPTDFDPECPPPPPLKSTRHKSRTSAQHNCEI